MGKKIKRIFVSICIVTGIALLAVPFYYHFHGQNETDKLIEQIEKTLEDNEDETEESKEEGKEQTSLSKEDAALLSGEDVIGIIEIEAIDIKSGVIALRNSVVEPSLKLGDARIDVKCDHDAAEENYG